MAETVVALLANAAEVAHWQWHHQLLDITGVGAARQCECLLERT